MVLYSMMACIIGIVLGSPLLHLVTISTEFSADGIYGCSPLGFRRFIRWTDVVMAVVADKNYGDDRALYEKMGYVRKSVRASGLTRKSKAATAAAK
jgi:hypothetical protein